MTARPTSFEPLASSDPVPGDAYEVAALAKRLSDTADEISTQVTNLRKLAEHSAEFWTGKAASKFHDSASDLATRIDKAHGRYATTGQVLSGWSKTIDEAQADVYPAVLDAQQAQADLQASAPLPAAPAGSPPPTADDQAAARRRAGDHADAQTRLNHARSRFEAAVDVYNTKARQAAGSIGDASSHDGLKDSWWDRNFHWIHEVMKWVAIAIIVLAVIAIIIACPFAGPLLAALAMTAETVATLATVVEVATAILVGLSLAVDSAAALTGKQSWTAAALDLVSLATMGFGELAAGGVRGIATYGSDVAKAVTAGRVGREAMAAAGYPKALWSLASTGGLRALLETFPRVGRALEGADAAVADAQKGLDQALEHVKPSSALSMLTQKAEIAENFAKVNLLSQRLPTVLRLGASKVLAGVVVASDAAAQASNFVVATSYTVASQLEEATDDHRLEDRLDVIVSRFTNPLVHIP